jgi:hypothetical protein
MGWKKPPSGMATSLKRKKQRVSREVTGVAGRAVSRVADEASDRLQGVKRVSKQDSPTGKDLRPRNPLRPATNYRVIDTGVSATVEVFPFWAGAKSKAVTGVYGYLGRSKDLERAGLIVISNKGRGVRTRDAAAAGGKQRFILFTSNPELRVWGEREQKGMQVRRHSVYIRQEVLRLLVMGPSMRSAAPDVLADWKAGVHRGFL